MFDKKEYKKKYRAEHREEISKYNKEYGKRYYQSTIFYQKDFLVWENLNNVGVYII